MAVYIVTVLWLKEALMNKKGSSILSVMMLQISRCAIETGFSLDVESLLSRIRTYAHGGDGSPSEMHLFFSTKMQPPPPTPMGAMLGTRA